MNGFFHDLITGLVAGVVSGGIIFGATVWYEDQSTAKQERQENLRFIRQVITQEGSPMPFRGLDLQGVNLTGLNFACRDKVRIEGCSRHADFRNANLRGADFSLVDATEADFSGADVAGANFRLADIRGAVFFGAKNLEKADFYGACFDTTYWPEDFTPPAIEWKGEICAPKGL
jgi:uncharacterized protein YjbI with pentapeptide repeats